MCGIAGTYGFVDKKLASDMAKVISHRGPDGEGFYFGDSGSLVSRRLAIIDVAGGHMPISNEDDSIWIVYNGEIYNHLELTAELKKAGHTYKTHSDTEMVLHAYEEWGFDCVKRFNGMFGFALYDSKKSIIFAARDQFGIKPFYYTYVEEGYIFASEIKAFFSHAGFSATPNNPTLFKYLAYRMHDDSTDTFFANVNKILPGEYIVFSKEGVRVQKYFDLDLTAVSTLSKEEQVAEFKRLFIKSVKDRLMSEVSVGTCLSGGLDSSAVVCVINKLLTGNVTDKNTIGDLQKTFSAVFPNEINNEETYIDSVLESTKTEKNYIYPNSKELFLELKELVYYQEEPFISSGPYAQWCVMKEAHKKVKVLLDGQGSDELMAGYTPYMIVYLKELLSAKKYAKFIKESFYCLPQIKNLIQEKVNSLFGYQFLLSDFISDSFKQKHKTPKPNFETSNLKKRLHDDLFKYSIPSLLRYEDKNSMAFSIEGRVPFLDPDLVKFIFTLPSSMLINKGYTKYVMREALKDILPGQILNRKWKVGFTTPEVAWFREQKESVYEIINSASFRSREVFNYSLIKQFVADFYDGKHDESMVIWRFINLELWYRIFIDNRPTEN